MKNIIKFAAIASIAALYGATAFAGEKSDAKCKNMGEHMQAKAEDHFKAVDADSDGAITEAELLAFVTAKAKAEFASMAGDDSSVSLDEMKAHHKAKHEEMMKGHAGMDHGKMDHGDHKDGHR